MISPGDGGEALAYCHGCADGKVYPSLVDWLRDERRDVDAGSRRGP